MNDKEKLEHLEKAFKRHLVLYEEKQRQQDNHLEDIMKQQIEFTDQIARLIKVAGRIKDLIP